MLPFAPSPCTHIDIVATNPFITPTIIEQNNSGALV
jgi:hypothetical protein